MKLVRLGWQLSLLQVVTVEALGKGNNANHIFNAVHSSMRQWGSSLNHNGMSIFMATVPAGTEFYHGTSSPYRINGTQWLAFEPEHALMFARPEIRPPRRRDHGHGPPPPHHNPDDEHDPPRPIIWHDRTISPRERINTPRRRKSQSPAEPIDQSNAPRLRSRQDQIPIIPRPGIPGSLPGNPMGYLHTYRTHNPLHLVYLDGQSAAKSELGTLDTQDRILRQLSAKYRQKRLLSPPAPLSSDLPAAGGPMDDGQRAADMCSLASTTWKDRIDGFLRMEGGFEIILCDFKKHLTIETISAVEMLHTPGMSSSAYDYMKAVTARYDGIGNGRVEVAWDSMITLFDYPDSMDQDEKGRPRVKQDAKDLDKIGTLLERHTRMDWKKEDRVNWQAVADMVVGRYGDRIQDLASGRLETLEDMQLDVTSALRPFIDSREINHAREVERCAKQFWPATDPSEPWKTTLMTRGTAARAVHDVAHVVCNELSRVRDAKTFPEAMGIVTELKEWLGWTTWKKCRGCDAHEICFLPIWPWGREEDFEHPQCVGNSAEFGLHFGYWNMQPPRKDKPGEQAPEEDKSGKCTEKSKSRILFSSPGADHPLCV
ncbi:Hypothetical protein D9617_3g017990 [Elsinoe fawcettii]|nr:Hypothetical protein D9617_3g017990 [Elsinoe fawcettii]